MSKVNLQGQILERPGQAGAVDGCAVALDWMLHGIGKK